MSVVTRKTKGSPQGELAMSAGKVDWMAQSRADPCCGSLRTSGRGIATTGE